MKRFSSAGFSLPDIILVLAIIAVLSSTLYPSISGYLAKGREKEETAKQEMIVEAFETYLTAVGEMPSNVLSASNVNQAWNRSYAGFTSDTVVTNLSLNDMRDDVFGNRRGVFVASMPVSFSSGSYDVYYVAVVSTGEDGCFGPDADGRAPCDNSMEDRFEDVDGSAGFTLADYNALAVDPDSDDIITKYTDAGIKREAYNKLLMQVSEIEEALDQFAFQAKKRAETMVQTRCQARVVIDPTPDTAPFTDYSIYNCYEDVRAGALTAVANEMPDSQIFYPPSSGATLSNYDVSFGGDRYAVNAAISATTPIYGSARSRISNNSGTGQAGIRDRRRGMLSLMSLLGLPSRYCCNPLDKYFDATTGQWESMPLFYYSDPREIRTNSR